MYQFEKKLKIDRDTMMSPNLYYKLSESDCCHIESVVYDGFETDLGTRDKWEKRMSAAMDLAIQMTKNKTFPWPGCSNVAFPLVTIATMQFHSRAYPSLVQGSDLVRYKVNGSDPNMQLKPIAEIISNHMSWQLLEENEEWEVDHDRLLINLPIIGCAFKKTYHTVASGRNISELVMARDLVLDYFASSVEKCGRKTHIIPAYRNELWEKMAAGAFCDHRDEPWFQQDAVPYQHINQTDLDRRSGTEAGPSDSNTPFSLLEQHCFLDLDGDGYAEPYIVTIEYNSRKLLRIVARWDTEDAVVRDGKNKILRIVPTEYFTKYTFIPSPDGSIYDLGLGILLGSLNESVNSLLNQLIDAGTMSNSAGGFIGKGAKIRSGTDTFSPLEWKRMDSTADDIRKNIFPLPVREPSAVLFNLLNLLINYTDRISGSTDIMVGENPGQNTPAETSRNMLEMGGKVYTAILKRCWRSMRSEFRKLYLLNSIFLPSSSCFGPEGTKVLREYYKNDPARIMPAADPNVASTQAKMQQAITIKQAAASTPGYDPVAVERNFLRAMQVDGIDVLYPGPEKIPPGKSEKIQLEEMRLESKRLELEFQQKQFILNLAEQRSLIQAQIISLQSKAIKDIAEAKAKGMEVSSSAIQQHLDMLKAHDESLRDRMSLVMEGKANAETRADGGRRPELAPPPSDDLPSTPLDQVGGGAEGAMEPGAVNNG